MEVKYDLCIPNRSLGTRSRIKADSPEAEKKPVILKAMAYLEAAKIRGDSTASILKTIDTETRYKVHISDEDRRQISQYAQEIYKDLEAQRISQGLGEFDNTVPPLVQSYFNNLEKKIRYPAAN